MPDAMLLRDQNSTCRECVRIIGFLMFSVLLPMSIIKAQWAAEFRLTSVIANARTTPGSGAQSIVASGDTVHVVWQENRSGTPRVYYQRSTNNGNTWEAEQAISSLTGATADYPSIAVSGALTYIAWEDDRDAAPGYYAIYGRGSSDGGATWGEETPLVTDSMLSRWPSVAIAGTTIHLSWAHASPWEINYMRSDDGGATWGETVQLTDWELPVWKLLPCIATAGDHVHVVWQQREEIGDSAPYDIFYRGSSDGGMSWNTQKRLTEDPKSSISPSLHADQSNVFVCWHDTRTGALDIHYMASTDGGMVWREDTPLQLSAWNCRNPHPVLSGATVHLVWADERQEADGIYYIRSTDLGETWEDGVRLSSGLGTSSYPYLAVSGSQVHALWTNDQIGTPELYYTSNPTGNTVTSAYDAESVPAVLTLEQNFPNPSTGRTHIRFEIKSAGWVRLSIHDVLGREVSVLSDGWMSTGRYEIGCSTAELNSGMYGIRLQVGPKVLSRMMIVAGQR